MKDELIKFLNQIIDSADEGKLRAGNEARKQYHQGRQDVAETVKAWIKRHPEKSL